MALLLNSHTLTPAGGLYAGTLINRQRSYFVRGRIDTLYDTIIYVYIPCTCLIGLLSLACPLLHNSRTRREISLSNSAHLGPERCSKHIAAPL